MSAIEFLNLDLSQVVFTIRDSVCVAALFQRVIFGGGDRFENTDLSRTVFSDCCIEEAFFIGNSAGGSLANATHMMFRSADPSVPARLGETLFQGYRLDGFVLEGWEVSRPVRIVDCSLLRSHFKSLDLSRDSVWIDVTGSDVLYSQIDTALLAETRTEARTAEHAVRLTENQWNAVHEVHARERDLRLSE